jgi:hypothetical protein
MTTTIWVFVWFMHGLGAPPGLVHAKSQLDCQEMLAATLTSNPGDLVQCAAMDLSKTELPIRPSPNKT